MAIRNIRIFGDPVLEKVCKEVKEVTPRTKDLIDDMILKRICVVDVTYEDPIVLINPKIIEASGEQTGSEGCLSYPGKCGDVTRADYVKVEYYDENMEKQIVEGTELLARALQHEIDHLDGHLYTEKVIGEVRNVGEETDENYEENEE